MRQFVFAAALLVSVAASAAIPSSQRAALVAINSAAGGGSWTDHSGWLGAAGTECSWYGVTCDAEQANVIRLELPENNLSGTISSKISDLPKLQVLQLWTNDLQGTLPAGIGQLADLEYVNLTHNRLSGQIPASLASLDKLVHLGLDDNRFSGTLPDAIGGLAALEELEIAANTLIGGIPPALANLTHLKILDLGEIDLDGAIPSALGSMTTLESLSLGGNELTGGIPRELGGLAALKRLMLSYNHLQGPIPPELGQLSALEELDLWGNELTGHIPAEFEGLTAIRKLWLTDNLLDGPIPEELFQLTALEELVLAGNDLDGEISAAIGNLTNLQVLVLSQNHLTGTIPAELALITGLQVLEVFDNELTGTIPPQLGLLTGLTTLDLAGNHLEGPIPSELGDLTALDALSLYANRLEGPIPSSLGNLTQLTILFLADNRLTGAIPDPLRNLRALVQWKVHQNALSGSIPSWIGELTDLTDLAFGSNRLTGEIPAGVSGLEKLVNLDFGDNQLTGPLPDLSHLTQLVSLNAAYNQLSGPLPASIGAPAGLEDLLLEANGFTGTVPTAIGNLTNVLTLDLSNNSLEGSIPASLGALHKAVWLSLRGNRFGGAIPKELGNMSDLRYLDVSRNALRGPLPSALSNLDTLEDAGSDFGFNLLTTTDSSLRAFVNAKQGDGDFEATQTVTPSGLHVVAKTDRNATLAWTKIRYTWDGGGYQVTASTTPSGAPVALATTSSKEIDSITLRNLSASTTYYFQVSAVSHLHGEQQNLLVSDASPAVSTKTGAPVVAPADVAISDPPRGLVQIDGTPAGDDSLTVTNFGDLATTITLQQDGSFFTVAPQAFALAGGASQTVALTSVSRPAGTYFGEVAVEGTGAAEGLVAGVVLLSVARPSGTVIARPVETRIELAGAPGSDSVGTVAFLNAGTATLTGILLSDQPWVVPVKEPLTIAPGTTGSVNFTVVRSKRPAGAEGALTANLSLVYVDGGAVQLLAVRESSTTVPGVSISTVTVVDVTKPPVAPGTIPSLGAGEVALFAPGLENVAGQLRSDLMVVNAAGVSSIGDLKLYFTIGSQTSVASLLPLAWAQFVNLVNVGSVYGVLDGVGSMQIRSGSWEGISADSKVSAVTDSGTFAGTIPVFRGDRSIAEGRSLVLAGVAQPADLFVQETAGAAAAARIEFLSATGAAAAAPRDENLDALGLLVLRDAVPAGAVTLIVTNTAGSAGRISAYARVKDADRGDSWSVVDWSVFNDFRTADAVCIPFVDGRGASSGKRRAVPHAAGSARATTDVALFNPGSAAVRATLRVIESSGRVVEREVSIGPRATTVLRDAGSSAHSDVAHLVIEPSRGDLVATARSYRSAGGGTVGSAVPVVAATAGLRIGQSRIFTGLDDSAGATVAAGTPATFRTSYGLVETAGAAATVRAEIVVDDSSALVSAVTSRMFELGPGQQVLLPELLRSFAGDERDAAYGDLHDLTLEIEVTAGSGAVVPYVITTDNGTGDSVLRVR